MARFRRSMQPGAYAGSTTWTRCSRVHVVEPAAPGQEGAVAGLIRLLPPVGLLRAGNPGLQGDSLRLLLQAEYRLSKVKVASPSQAAGEGRSACLPGRPDRPVQLNLQRTAPGVCLPAAPGQLLRAMPRKSADHSIPPLPQITPLHAKQHMEATAYRNRFSRHYSRQKRS